MRVLSSHKRASLDRMKAHHSNTAVHGHFITAGTVFAKERANVLLGSVSICVSIYWAVTLVPRRVTSSVTVGGKVSRHPLERPCPWSSGFHPEGHQCSCPWGTHAHRDGHESPCPRDTPWTIRGGDCYTLYFIRRFCSSLYRYQYRIGILQLLDIQ